MALGALWSVYGGQMFESIYIKATDSSERIDGPWMVPHQFVLIYVPVRGTILDRRDDRGPGGPDLCLGTAGLVAEASQPC